MSQQYDNRGKVSLWKRASDAAQGAPALKGKVYAHRNIREGEELDIALWRNDSENPKAPMMTGKVSDVFKKPVAQYNDSPMPDPEPFNDEIPW